MSGFCKKCISYESGIFTRHGGSFGICHKLEVADKITLDGKTILGQDGVIYCEEYFGCIYWRDNDGVLINFNDIIDNKTGMPK